METKLTTKVGDVPAITVTWADIYAANESYNAIMGVLRNHRQNEKEPKSPVVYISDEELKRIATILFHMTHLKEEVVDLDECGPGRKTTTYHAIIENSDFDINQFI